jgi:hypothetical protein
LHQLSNFTFKKIPFITVCSHSEHKKVIYTDGKNLNLFSAVTQQAEQGNYMSILFYGKETQLFMWTGSRAASVKNTIQLPKLKNYIYEIKFYNNTAIIILP